MYQTPTSATVTVAASAEAAIPARHAAMSQSGARKMARSLRNPMARPQAAEARTSAADRPRAATVARQKRSAQPTESAARSVYG